jgi:NADPH:quinone reductase-like Zn-dependent oxidoreductase
MRRVLSPAGVLGIVGGEGGNAWTGGFLERMASASWLSLFSKQKMGVVNAVVNVPDLLALKELVEANKLIVALDHRYRLEEAVAALKELEKGHSRGKSVVVMNS